MKNTEENKKLWVEKVQDVLKMGGKSDVTYNNYKSHINRFLNYITFSTLLQFISTWFHKRQIIYTNIVLMA